MRRAVLLVLLGLGGCDGARYAAEAQAWAAGRPLAEVEACIGVPDRTDRVGEVTIVQWQTGDPAVPVSLPLPIVGAAAGVVIAAVPAAAFTGSMSLALGGGACRAIAEVRGGVVAALRYAGPGDGVSGRNAMCGVDLVRGCVR